MKSISAVFQTGLQKIMLQVILTITIGLTSAAANVGDHDGPFIVFNPKTGRVLDAQRVRDQWHPASLTKLMTAYVAFGALSEKHISMNSAVTISANALKVPPSKMGFRTGTKLTVGNALKMVVVKSANDIAVALGERIAGSESSFVRMMNREALRLGMVDTNFVNPHGLHHKDQVTSARDMALLTHAIIREYPQHAELFRTPAIRHGKRVLKSYNKLLRHFRGTDGMKTGFVCASGFNQVASATRNNKRLVSIVLGAVTATDRSEAAARLLTEGFSGKLSGNSTLGQWKIDTSHSAAPVNMRPAVCRKNNRPRAKRASVGDGNDGSGNGVSSYLIARFKTMDAVRVHTGLGAAAGIISPVVTAVPRPKPEEMIIASNQAVELIDLSPDLTPRDFGPRPKP